MDKFVEIINKLVALGPTALETWAKVWPMIQDLWKRLTDPNVPDPSDAEWDAIHATIESASADIDQPGPAEIAHGDA